MRKNTILLIIYEIAIYLAPLVTAPYIARVLGTHGTGVYSYTHSIASYFVLFIQLGVSLYGRREIASLDDKDAINKTFWSIFASTGIMFVIISCVYFLSISIFFNDYKVEMFFQFLLLVSAWLDISWLYFGLEKFKIAISRNLIVKFLSLILVFLLIKSQTDTIKYIAIMTSTNLLSVIVMWLTLKKYVGKAKITFDDIRSHYKNLFVLFVPILAVQLYSITDKVCLGILSDLDSVGIYENVYKISRVPVSIITAIGTVMLPKITKMIANGKKESALKYIDKSLSITLIVGIGCAFGLIAISEPFVKLYLGNDFSSGIPVLQLLSFVLIIIAWGNVFRMQYILPNKMDKIYLSSVLYGALINIILNIVLIPKSAGIGAAIASVISEFIVCIYQSFKIKDSFEFKKLLLKNLKYFIAGIIMCICTMNLDMLLQFNKVLNVIIDVIFGIIIYSITIVLFEIKSREKIFTDELKRFVKKVINFRSVKNV